METENKSTVGTLNEKILDILDEGQEWDKQTPDTIILEFQKVAKEIEQLILEEVGKAFDSGENYGIFRMQCLQGNGKDKKPNKEQYITSLTKK